MKPRLRACRHPPILSGSQDHEAGVSAGREAADVADASVERHDHARVVGRGLDDDGVLASTQLLVEHRVDVVTASSEFIGAVVREVLSSSLGLTRAAGRSLSRASAAPYAAAARMPSRSSDNAEAVDMRG
jgi:hypothetical protein